MEISWKTNIPPDCLATYAQEIKRIAAQAQAGDANSQFIFAECYNSGNGVTLSSGKAFHWYLQAAEQGHVQAQNEVAVSYFRGETVTKDMSKCFEWLSRAAEQNLPEGILNLGWYYYAETDDIAAAAQCFRRAGELGNAEAQCWTGLAYLKGEGFSQNYAEAVIWFRLAANAGNERAQNELGKCYLYGLGVLREQQEAIHWLQLAVDAAMPDAVMDLAFISILKGEFKIALEMVSDPVKRDEGEKLWVLSRKYHEGDGVKKGASMWLDYCYKAAMLGHPRAQELYSDVVPELDGVSDYEQRQSVKFLHLAAVQGSPSAQNRLAMWYQLKRLMPNAQQVLFEDDDVDCEHEMYWYLQAAKNGSRCAQHTLGCRYRAGNHVPKDLVESLYWFQLAGEGGDARPNTC